MLPIPHSVSKNLKKRSWTSEEDQKLIDYKRRQREKEPWDSIARNAGLNRSGLSCRLRYVNYLDPDIKRGDFSEDEVHKIIELQSKHGNR
jgi:myb proto-oncogene protein